MAWYNFWKSGETPPADQQQKQKTSAAGRRVAQVLYTFMPGGQVVWSAQGQSFLESGYLGNHIVFALQDWKSKKCATPPPLVYRVKDRGKYSQYKALLKDPTSESLQKAQVLKYKALDEVEQHPALDVLRRPNPVVQSWFELCYSMITMKDQVGSWYLYGVRGSVNGKRGPIRELWLLPSQDVDIVTGGWTQPIQAYRLRSKPDMDLPVENIAQGRHFSPLYGATAQHLYGVSRLKAASKLLDKYADSVEAETEAFQNRGARDVVFPMGVTDSDEIPVGQVDQMQERFNQRLKEQGNNAVMVMGQEMGGLKVGLSPVDLNILESQTATKEDFCSIYHISKEVLGYGDQSTYNNVSEGRKMSLVDAVLPELELIKDIFNSWLMPSYSDSDGEYVIDFDYEAFPELAEDMKATVDALKEAWWISPNERRLVQKYEEKKEEGADSMWVPKSLQRMEHAAKEPEPAQPKGGVVPAGKEPKEPAVE